MTWSSVEPQIADVITEMETYRKASLPKAFGYGVLIGILITVGVLLLLFFLMGFTDVEDLGGAGLFIGVFAIITSCIGTCDHYLKRLAYTYKTEVMPKLVGVICQNAVYDPDGGISAKVFYNSGLFPWDSTTFLREEDYIAGKVDKTDFEFCEAQLGHEETTTDQKGRTTTHEVTDFQGMAFNADFNKNFNGQTTVSTSSVSNSLRKIKMESVDFNKIFKTYCADEIEARYLLSPALQERLVNLYNTMRETIGERHLTMTFLDSRLLIFISTGKDRFEPTLLHKMSLERVEKDFSCIKVMVDIVEDLNLNTRIWTKE